jgi:hypothetical protein
MNTYRKKPVVISAVQWTGGLDNELKLIEFAGEDIAKSWMIDNYEFLTIPTIEGKRTANKGDWIIRGVMGEFYLCKPDIFEMTYESADFDLEKQYSFGEAIDALKQGKKVTRSGWNGKGMFIFLVQGSTFKVNSAPLLGIYPEGTEVTYHAHIDMKTADNQIVPWLASQTDMLAEDWIILID